MLANLYPQTLSLLLDAFMKNLKQEGLTLIEILIVIIIIGILIAIAVPNFLNWLPNMRLSEAARELHSLMQETKTEAIRTNQAKAIVFQPAINKYSLCSSPGVDNDWSTLGNNTVTQTYDFAKYGYGVGYGVANIVGNNSVSGNALPADNVSFTSDVLVFNPSGTGNGGYVYLQNRNNRVFAIGTQTTGRVRLLKWTGTGWR